MTFTYTKFKIIIFSSIIVCLLFFLSEYWWPYYFAKFDFYTVSSDGRYRVDNYKAFFILPEWKSYPTFVYLIDNKTKEILDKSCIFNSHVYWQEFFDECGVSSQGYGDLIDKKCWIKKYPNKKPYWETDEYKETKRSSCVLYNRGIW